MTQQFIPFEDDWDALSRLGKEALVPYRFEYRQPSAVTIPSGPAIRHASMDAVAGAVTPTGQGASLNAANLELFRSDVSMGHTLA